MGRTAWRRGVREHVLSDVVRDSEGGSRGFSGNCVDGGFNRHRVGRMAVHARSQCHLRAAAADAIGQLKISRGGSRVDRVIAKFSHTSGTLSLPKVPQRNMLAIRGEDINARLVSFINLQLHVDQM